jgi:hypothetical protein
MRLVKIGKNWVNPEYVTCIQPAYISMPKGGLMQGTRFSSKVWVVGNAGYGTLEINSTLTPDELAKKLTQEEKDD